MDTKIAYEYLLKCPSFSVFELPNIRKPTSLFESIPGLSILFIDVFVCPDQYESVLIVTDL